MSRGQAGRFLQGGAESAEVSSQMTDGNIFDSRCCQLGAASVDIVPGIISGFCPMLNVAHSVKNGRQQVPSTASRDASCRMRVRRCSRLLHELLL